MRAAFIPALPPSALLAGMIAPSFRLVNRFCGKKLLRTCGRRERPPALCAVWARSPLAYVKGSLPFDRSLWHRPSLRRTQATRALRAPERRKKRVSPHPAAVPAGPCSLSQSAEAPLHAPAPAAVGASPRPPLAPWVRASPAPAARERFECPKARREASALWAVGPKAQSDPKRGSETMSATGGEARMIEQPGCKKRVSPHPAAVTAGPCFLSQSAKAPLHASASAAVDASPRPPLAPWVRASPPPLRTSVSSVQRREGKRVPCGHLGRRPKATRSGAAKP